jgi:hypothetical protein
LENNLNNLEKENEKITNNYNHLYKKMNKNSKRLSLLIKIIDELNNDIEDEVSED